MPAPLFAELTGRHAMAFVDEEKNRDRLKASFGVAAFHALLGYALITGLGFEVATRVSDSLKLFDVNPPLPPPPIEEPKPLDARSKEEEGAAAPPNLKSQPSPVVAPPPKVQLKVPPPVVTAPVTAPVTGNDRSAGASDREGPGTGAGGEGTGTGSGRSGLGTGGGGGGARARLVRGRLLNQDYPRPALRAGIEGSVFVRFTVQTDGRAEGCTVTRSSGDESLDSTTCRLIERRFRYEPARDPEGRPVPEVVTKVYDWIIPGRAFPEPR